MKLAGHIVTPTGVVTGEVDFGAVIQGVQAASGVPDRFIVPGFVDTHVHGGDGGDVMDGPDGITKMAKFHLRHGTTTLLPTTVTRPWAEVMEALRAIAACRDAQILGAHLEGPFISPARLGAQPPFPVLPTEDLVSQAVALDVIRVVTLAPELQGAAPAIGQFVRGGVRVSLGHSAADYATAEAALAGVAAAGGVAAGTHLFNAMGGIEGRAPGLAGALLGSTHAFSELILDLHHVHAGAFQVARKALGDRLMLITDAIRGAGTGDGESELGGQRVTILDGVARLANGSLAGSVLTMDQAFRNAVGLSVPMQQVVRLTSSNAAVYLGLTDRGAIAPGLRADLVVLDMDQVVQQVWVGGARAV